MIVVKKNHTFYCNIYAIFILTITAFGDTIYPQHSCTFKMLETEGTGYLEVSSSSATAITSFPYGFCTLYVDIVGQFYVAGSTKVDSISNHNSKEWYNVSAEIQNVDYLSNYGEWINVHSEHYCIFDGQKSTIGVCDY